MPRASPPRYAPQRPRPRYAHRPGITPHPTRDPRGHSFGDRAPRTRYRPASEWRSMPAYLWGIDLYNEGYFWEAHEAWEDLWRAAGDDATQRELVRGLIQAAACALKAELGSGGGARSLGRRAVRHLRAARARAAAPVVMGLAVDPFAAALERFAEPHPNTATHRPPLLVGTVFTSSLSPPTT